ncbi:MAG: hypothetical protein RBG13Loki_0981 [Promethearchaeota archaeon CR_4]|nr:MAG: hypothetical protein RBG13Loki_0981 [Candidatus Lokiarchaeota archaeon CR_4]
MPIDRTLIERNYRLIEERMKIQADISLRFGEQLIDEEFKGGLSSLVVRPTVKLFYSFYAKKNLKEATIKQLYVVLNTAKELLLVDKKPDDPDFQELVLQNSRDYIKNDSTVLYCKKKHPNFRRLIENVKEGFLFQVKHTWMLLGINGDINGYTDLCRKAYKTREAMRETMITQMDFIGRGISIVESDQSILDVPVARSLIMRVLRNGYEQTRAQFLRDIDNDLQT